VHNLTFSFVVVDLLVIFFQEALQFKKIIILCYNRYNFMIMNEKVPPLLTWHICCIIVDSFGLVVFTYILHQSKGHWWLSDTLNFAISMILEFKDEINFVTFDNLMEEDGNVVYELSCLASNKKKEVQVLDSFLSFLKNEEKKVHNMLFLMLDPRFKTFHLVSSLIGCEQGKAMLKNMTIFFFSYAFKMLLSFASIG